MCYKISLFAFPLFYSIFILFSEQFWSMICYLSSLLHFRLNLPRCSNSKNNHSIPFLSGTQFSLCPLYML